MSEEHKYLDRNRELKSLAKALRKNATKEEKHLWYDCLTKMSVKFYRQYIIDNYIVDFFSPKVKLIIEVDGLQHYESKQSIEKDLERTKKLESYGFTVLRFTNREVNLKFKNVCEHIYKTVEKQLIVF